MSESCHFDRASNEEFSVEIWIFVIVLFLKFIYYEKVTKVCEISTVDLSYVVTVKSTLEISQNFAAFLEYLILMLAQKKIKTNTLSKLQDTHIKHE